MQKKLSILLAALITLSTLASYVPVKASIGNILVGVKLAPSPVTVIKLGQSVNLYFEFVTWSGGTIDLYISPNGYAALNTTTDLKYSPPTPFSVADLKASVVKNITYGDLSYKIGYNWINGTVPVTLAIAGGDYYIKAFDGITAAVAVTDNYIKIKATFEVTPSFGPGGNGTADVLAKVSLKGYALPKDDYANLSYYDPIAGKNLTIVNLYRDPSASERALGRFTYTMAAPDLKRVIAAAGPQNESLQKSTITFYMTVNSTKQSEKDTYDEYYRGLEQVKGKTVATAPTGFLFGNTTDFTTGAYLVDVEVNGSMIIVGKWFHPGALTILWDGVAIDTTTANSTHGWFNDTFTVPITSKGKHTVTIDDRMIKFVFYVNVIPTLILVPDEGPVGTHVVAYGYGFPAKGKPAAANVYNVTLEWDYVDACDPVTVVLKYVLTDANGYFVVPFDVPHTVGGAHTVTAWANDTPSTIATDIFTVTATLIVSPLTFPNNGTIVWVNGTGLAYYGWWYDLNLDNKKNFWSVTPDSSWGFPTYFTGDCLGDFSFQFVAAGFEPGLHVVSLYKLSAAEEARVLPTLEAYVLFNVTSPEANLILVKLDEALENLDEIKESLGDLTDLVEDESTHIDTVRDAILDAIEDARGDVSALAGQLSAIQTLASTAAQQASSAAASSSTAASNASDAKTAAQAAQSTASGISMAVYGAVVLSLIAALASIVAVITLQRKVAG